ncbi:MAG: DUF4833 domain-containing protein [Leptolyngbyaceae cyanobacterium MO_188.B28]|nr:DUF4833 domain-containing protein [Leptolyngbyaceae cyanobacterium MO_188.B28]
MKKFSTSLIALTIVNLFWASLPVRATGDRTAFYVSSSGSRSQVNYDIQLNEDCNPADAASVDYYMLRSDGSTRELNSMEQEGYGIAEQLPLSNNRLDLRLNVFQQYGIDKTLTISSSKDNTGDCQIKTFTTINDSQSQLSHVYVDVDRTKVLGVTVRIQILSLTLVGLEQQAETITCTENCVYGL